MSRVDLQPLLVQLSQRLAAALAGCGSTGSSTPGYGVGSGPGTALLSALRQQCVGSGATGTQASTQVGYLPPWLSLRVATGLKAVLCCAVLPQ